MNEQLESGLQVHSFNTNIAKKVGMLAATIYHHLEFWIQKNQANNKHFHEGYYWTYSSVTAFQKIFYYATTEQIRYALRKLKDEGFIETGSFNKAAYDRTIWYRLTNGYGEIPNSTCENSQMDLVGLPNGSGEIPEPIPDILTDIKTDINTQSYDCVYYDTNDISIPNFEPAEPVVVKKKSPVKHKYGEYENVLLTDGDLEKLKQKFPSTYEEKIQMLSEGKEMRGYKYKNDYLAILKWAERDGYKEEHESQPVSLSELEAYITPEGERRFRRKGAQ